MEKSPFLSDVAKTYYFNINHVSFCSPKEIENCDGQVFIKKSVEEYRILLNENLLFCANKVLWAFSHEIGHVVLGHLKLTDSERLSQELSLEKTADEWAFNQMGTFNQKRKFKKESIPCFKCIKNFYPKCLKEFK